MAVTVTWLILAAVVVAWELGCRRSHGRWTSLADLGARLGSHRSGRLVLVALWAFVGWHVFARYTLPG
ncbi:MAG: DUF6186 family protein [Acidimicrobiales bacterium]